MKLKKYLRNGKIVNGLEVSKKELLELKKNNPFISISEADINNIKGFKDLDILGAIFGDIQNISELADSGIKKDLVDNPDCWFVFVPNDHGYKDIELSDFTFGEAIELLKLGYKVAREEWWRNENKFLFMSPDNWIDVVEKIKISDYPIKKFIVMKTENDELQLGWTPTQEDMLSEDWVVIK